MKAAWYEEIGEAKRVLQIGEQPTPAPQADEVLVRLHTSGINPSDVKTRGGARGSMPFPLVIPHSDGGGVIEAVGENIDETRIGQSVWLWNAAWQRAYGTAAEYICLPAAQAVALPENTDFQAAACLGIPASTACYGVFADGEIEGQTILVTAGAGAVGHYAIQLAKWGGARVITTISNAQKAELARKAGADLILNYRQDKVADAILDFTEGAGVARIVEVEFGGNLDIAKQVIAIGGTIASYGSMAAATPPLPFYDLMFRHINLRLFLVYLLTQKQRALVIDKLTQAMQQDALQHIIAATFPLEDIATAHEAVESGQMIGNVVLTI